MALLKPEVYEVAAELIATEHRSYSCDAIAHAVDEVYSKERMDRRDGHAKDHATKFERYFAPRLSDGHLATSLWSADDVAAQEKHPFWNKGATPWRQNNRVQALLMMAEIVRSEPGMAIKH